MKIIMTYGIEAVKTVEEKVGSLLMKLRVSCISC